jgi:integrase
VHRPHIPMLEVRNARKGFFDREQVEGLLKHLPDHLQPVVRAAYATGWRIKSEVLTRQWKHVDLVNGWLRLEPGETKNSEGRMFPLTPELRKVLEAQRVATSVLERAEGRIVPWVLNSLPGGWTRRSHPARPAAVGGPESGTLRRSPVSSDGNGGPQDRVYLPALRHRGRGDVEGGCCKVGSLAVSHVPRHGRRIPVPEPLEKMVGWDGIEPPTPGFSDLGLSLCKHA